MGLIDENTKKEVEKKLKEMKGPVKLLYFDKKTEVNEQIKGLLNEVAALSDKLEVEVHDVGSEKAKEHNVENGPVILVKSEHVKGDARYYGIPSGYEFGPFLEIIKMAGSEIKLSNDAKTFFDSTDVKLEVFVTPTCPHCPTSAYVAMKFAMGSSKVKGYVYEAMEFPDIARKYKVMGVPKTVINEGKGEYVGGYPEDVAFVNIRKQLTE